MREIYENYVDLLDVRFRSNRLVVIIISLFIVAVGLLLPKHSNYTYNDNQTNSQISYYTK